MTSAENELGMDSQPFTTASPLAQIFLRVFSRTSASSISSRASAGGAPAPRRPAARTSVSRRSGASMPSSELGATYDPEVAPLADSEILGLLEVGDRRDVRGGIDQIRPHRADRESQLLLDSLEPLIVPGELRYLG